MVPALVSLELVKDTNNKRETIQMSIYDTFIKAENRESRWKINRRGTPSVRLLETVSPKKQHCGGEPSKLFTCLCLKMFRHFYFLQK